MKFRTGTEDEMRNIARLAFADTYPIVIDNILVCNLLGQTCDDYYMYFHTTPEAFVQDLLSEYGNGDIFSGIEMITEEYPEHNLNWIIKNKIVVSIADFVNTHHNEPDFKERYNYQSCIQSTERRMGFAPAYSRDCTKLQFAKKVTEEEKNNRLRQKIVERYGEGALVEK